MAKKAPQLGDILPISSPKCFSGNTRKNGLVTGDLVVNIKCEQWPIGKVVQLVDADGSDCPFFGLPGQRTCQSLSDFAPLSEFAPSVAQKPTVTSTMTVYSDGVKLNEETIEFDGKSWTREELRNTVNRYRQILNRPVAVVPVVSPKTKTVKKAVKKTTKK